ncbi:hypothetical protein [uncultured Tenacibaculum sp.]|uniref:hypothetical protein n=1 Tax=uncultured Tenacibaculum sp. TaxID=174713 RepID=UPI00261A9E51|nr:hypothetical protein [uncultured Tenacibaculum sp.]
MDEKSRSGKVTIEKGNIIWRFEDNEVVKVPYEKIKLIGEFTNANGPLMDDWFLVIYNDDLEYYEISMYANNITESLAELGELMGFELYGTLFTSIEWKSNILYPTKFKGNEIWDIVKPEPKSFLDKLKSLLGFNNEQLKLTKVAENIVNQNTIS